MNGWCQAGYLLLKHHLRRSYPLQPESPTNLVTRVLTTEFNNMQALKYKTQPTVCFTLLLIALSQQHTQ